jgi:hypothetical protein
VFDSRSITIFRVSISFFEASLTALKELLTETDAVLWFSRIVFEAGHEGIELWRTFFLDDKHAGCAAVLSGEPTYVVGYSIPLFSRRVLRFLAVENMYDLLSIVSYQIKFK